MQFVTKLKLFLIGILLLSSDVAIGFQSEVIVKDTFTDSDLWAVNSVFTIDAWQIFSTGPGTTTEFRTFVTFTGQEGVLSTISFPVIFSTTSSSPVNDPANYPLSVKLYEGYSELVANPLLIDAAIAAPVNNDWQSKPLTNISGFDVFFQEWDLSSLNYSIASGAQYFLSVNGIGPGASSQARPFIPSVTGIGNIIGGSDDFFTLENSQFDPPVPISDVLDHSQVAVVIKVSQADKVVTPDSFSLFRGIEISGSLSDFVSSDDVRARYNPGFTINSSEADSFVED